MMKETQWPEVSDTRLLTVLYKQVEGALNSLHESVDDGLIKLTDALEQKSAERIREDLIMALTDFQNIDRAMQRLANVKKCLLAWENSSSHINGSAEWADALAEIYVMAEEHVILEKVCSTEGGTHE
ncbi:MAG: hypothetical protein ACE5DY_05965 [Mariprofundaceae bacterium]